MYLTSRLSIIRIERAKIEIKDFLKILLILGIDCLNDWVSFC